MGNSEEPRPGEPTRTGEGSGGFPHGSHAPFVLAAGIFGVFFGLIYPLALIVGVPVFLAGVYLWIREYAIEEFESGIIPEQKRQRLGTTSAYLAGVFVIISELLLFGGAFLAWFFLDSQVGPFPLVDTPRLNVLNSIIMTGVLIIGSAVLYWGRKGLTNGNRSRLNIAMPVALAVGIVYLVVVAFDWSGLMATGLSPATGAYGAAFYYLTGMHAIHVFVGMILVGVMGYRFWGRGHFSENRHTMVLVVEAYWYLITWISVIILLFIYFPSSRAI